MSLEKKNRLLVLNKMYELSNGSSFHPFAEEELSSLLGLSETEIENILEYLKKEGLVDCWASGAFVISHYGIKEVEELIENPEQRAEHFLLINVIQNYSTITGLQQGNTYSNQTINISSENKVALSEIISSLNILKDSIQLLPEMMDEFVADIQTLEAQNNSPKPKGIIISETLKSVRTILEGAVAGVGTAMVADTNLFQKIESTLKLLG
ncbi:hypothetical protein [Adhaeribacter soli]|uniref:Uncharacterized protein n=1 Tax=Adhaeribacter soli TaxID=2607655 RepID=A0A5N1IQ65_9BACT|nr:hypothetical protein [Adhaeribacter soli]KAA9325600.1 hypothetical protein F0P94_16810 [Adhaeribacter soli]